MNAASSPLRRVSNGMSEDARPAKGLFARRLDHLFKTVHPKDRGPYTNPEVADAINKAAGENVISQTYIWQLRTGKRDNPTKKHISALAAFFGVSPLYFFADEEGGRDEIPPDVVQALKDDAVRDVALAAAGLSDESLEAIRALIDNARKLEGLPREQPAD